MVVIFLTCVLKLRVDDKITACVKEIIVSWVLHTKFHIEKRHVVKHFALRKNVYSQDCLSLCFE